MPGGRSVQWGQAQVRSAKKLAFFENADALNHPPFKPKMPLALDELAVKIFQSSD